MPTMLTVVVHVGRLWRLLAIVLRVVVVHVGLDRRLRGMIGMSLLVVVKREGRRHVAMPSPLIRVLHIGAHRCRAALSRRNGCPVDLLDQVGRLRRVKRSWGGLGGSYTRHRAEVSRVVGGVAAARRRWSGGRS